VWAADSSTLTLQGLVACHIAAVPFSQNWLTDTLFYSAVLFGGFALAERKLPVFALAHR